MSDKDKCQEGEWLDVDLEELNEEPPLHWVNTESEQQMSDYTDYMNIMDLMG